MIEITKVYEFEAAHHLPYHQGACQHLHGHSYKLEVTVTTWFAFCINAEDEKNPESGMIMDFSTLKEVIKKCAPFDHTNLNAHFANPTAENMVGHIAYEITKWLEKKHPRKRVIRVRLWETKTSYATWRANE